MNSKNTIHHLAQYDIIENDSKAQAIKDYLFDEIAKSKEESLKKETLLNKLHAEKNDLAKQIEQLQMQIRNLSDKSNDAKKHSDNQIIEILNDKYTLETEIKTLKNEVNKKEKELMILSEDLRRINYLLEIEKQRCENLQNSVNKLNLTLIDQKNNLDQYQFEIKNLNAKIVETQQSVNEKNIFIVEQNHKLKLLETEKSDLIKEINELNNKNNSLMISQTIKDKTTSELSEKIRSIDNDKNNLIQEVNECKRELAVLRSDLEQKEKMLVDAKYENEKTINLLTREFEKQITDDKRKYEIDLQKAQHSFENQMENIKNQAISEVTKAKKNHAADLESVQNGYQKYLSQLKEKHTRELQEILTEKDKAIKSLTLKLETDSELYIKNNKMISDQLNAEKEKIISELNEKYNHDTQKIINEYEDKISQLRSLNCNEINELKQEKAAKIQALTDMIEHQSQSTLKDYNEKLNQITQQYEQSILVQKEQYESSYNDIVLKYEKQIKSLKENFDATLINTKLELETKYQAENTKLEFAYKQIFQDSKIEKDFYEKELTQYRSENSDLKNQIEKLEIKSKILQKEISKQAKCNLEVSKSNTHLQSELNQKLALLQTEISERNENIKSLNGKIIQLSINKRNYRKKIKDSVKKLNRKNKARQAQFANLEKELSILRRDFFNEVEKYKNDFLEKEAQLIQNHNRKISDLQNAYDLVRNNLNSETDRYNKTISELTEQHSLELNSVRQKLESEHKYALQKNENEHIAIIESYKSTIAELKSNHAVELKNTQSKIESLQTERIEKLEAEILKYKKQTTALSNLLINYQNEKTRMLQQVNSLNIEIQNLSALSPIQSLLKVTQFELDKKELELKKMPSSSPIRSKIESQLEDLFKQRSFLTNLIEETQSELNKAEDKALQLKHKARLMV